MATKKKPKAKSAKKIKQKTSVPKTRKPAARKPARKKAVSKKKAAPKKSAKTKPSVARKPAPKLKPAPTPMIAPTSTPAAAPLGERIGRVTHYYNHLSVAIIELDAGSLRVGDVVHIKGHTSDFQQRVESIEIDHVHVNEAGPGKSFGLRVKEHAREHDDVYKVTQ